MSLFGRGLFIRKHNGNIVLDAVYFSALLACQGVFFSLVQQTAMTFGTTENSEKFTGKHEIVPSKKIYLIKKDIAGTALR
jgi:hypothetical protein